MTKGIFDKAKGGVIEGGLDQLAKAIKKEQDTKFKNWHGELTRICVNVPAGLRNAYKSKLAAVGKTIQEDLEDYVLGCVEKK